MRTMVTLQEDVLTKVMMDLLTKVMMDLLTKVMMDLGRDPRKGLISFFRVDCYQGCWLRLHILLNYIYLSQLVRSLLP